MCKKSFRLRVVNILTLLAFCILLPLSVYGQETLETLFAQFRAELKKPCGQRTDIPRLGKLIVEKYGNDELNREVIQFVKIRTEAIEKEEKRCQPKDDFTKPSREEIILKARQILLAEGDNFSIALDIMLDLVSAGFDDISVYKNKTYAQDTFHYAKLAIARIETGRTSNSGKWGAIFPFNTKENALSWMNYIVGWMMYHETNQKREALAYFYKSTQIGNEKKKDINIYTKIGSYYFDEAVRLDTEYREKRKADNNENSDETKAILAVTRGTTDRAMYFFAIGYKIAVETNAAKRLKDTLYNTLTVLYRFRFNFEPGYKPVELDEYIEKLINRPMPDPSKPFDPAWEELVEIKLKDKKWQ